MSKRSRRTKKRNHKPIHASLPANKSFNISDPDAEIVKIEAASGGEEGLKLKKFSMLAYTGGKVGVNAYYYPIVVDLAGMKVSAKSRPILRDHDTSRIVGHTDSVEINAGSIRVSGVVSASNEHAKEVQESSANGFPWQASIGARPTKVVFVDKGETVDVNGRKFTGPIYVARQSVLGEVSFVALGADDNTSASVAATRAEKEVKMNEFEKWLKAKGFDADTITEDQEVSLKAMFDAEHPAEEEGEKPKVKATAGNDGAALMDDIPDVKAEIRKQASEEYSRISAIKKHTADHPEIAAKAIAEDWDENKVQLEVLRAERPKAPAGHVHHDDMSQDVIASAVLMACQSQEDDIVASYGEKTVEAARKTFKRGVGLQELLMITARENGWHGRSFRGNERDILRAAFSTTSLPQTLGNTANKMIMEGFMMVETAWRRVANVRPVNDFKAHTLHRLTGDMTYEKVGPDGKLKHGEVGETNYTNQADTFGKMFSLTRRDIRNDDLGAFAAIRSRLGRGAGLAFNDVFWTEFLDNATFFATGNNNYFEGASSNLQSSSLQTAEQTLMDQTDEDGKPFPVDGKILLVPTALKVDADELYVSTNLNTGGSSTKTKVPDRNVHAGKYEPVVSRYIGNASYSGSSTTAWYLLADPRDIATMDVVFLDGQESPTVEEADANFDTLGIEFRGYHDFGSAKHEFRAGVKSKGAS